MRIKSAVIALLSLPFLGVACDAPGQVDSTTAAESAGLRDVLLVGNSAAGTVSFLDGHTFQSLGSINVIPDLSQRLAAINGDLFHAIAYSIITDKEKVKHFEPSN